MIAHIVLFNPKAGVSEIGFRSFAKTIQAACRQIQAIQRANVGRRIEVDAGYPRSFGEKTYRFVAIFEFEDPAGLREYLKHPLHKHLGKLFWEMCESTVVVEAAMADGRGEELVDFLLDDQ
jgi:stress responsive alpha/beta barrel protein